MTRTPNRPITPNRHGLSATLLGVAGAATDLEPDFNALRAAIDEKPPARALISMAFQDAEKAKTALREVERARAALAEHPDSAFARLRLADALRVSEQGAEAAKYYLTCLDDAETAPIARFALSSLGEADAPSKVPGKLVQSTFDQYAGTFEDDLVTSLKYQGPALLRDALESVSPLAGRRYEICDLGCGTGLVGVMFKDVASRLVGIDLSAEMLKGAEAKKLYERLYQADMVEALRRMDRPFDLALAGDVVIYLGDLAPLCQAVFDALNPGGLFAFTTETHESDVEPRVLKPSGRFQHADFAIAEAAVAAGLRERHRSHAAIRFERGAPVTGTTFVFSKG